MSIDLVSEERSESQLLRGLRALESLCHRSASAADVARTLSVNRSTSSRILQELHSEGYVDRDPVTLEYSIVASRFYSFVSSVRDETDWMQRVTPILTDARDRFGEASILGVPASNVMVYMGYLPSIHPIGVREWLGSVRPMHASAVGKAYLSRLSPRDLDDKLGSLDFSFGTERAARGPIELRKRLEQVSSHGYAVDREETFAEVSCVAAPVVVSGRVAGSIGVSGPTSRLPDASLDEIGSWLVERMTLLNPHHHGPDVAVHADLQPVRN